MNDTSKEHGPQSGNVVLGQALRLAEHGLKIFPCDPETKKSTLPYARWKGQATTDPNQIRLWSVQHWDHGAVIGIIPNSGPRFIVFDADHMKGDKPSPHGGTFEDSSAYLEGKLGSPFAFTQSRTQGNGHYWYVFGSENCGNAVWKYGEVRCDNYIILWQPSSLLDQLEQKEPELEIPVTKQAVDGLKVKSGPGKEGTEKKTGLKGRDGYYLKTAYREGNRDKALFHDLFIAGQKKDPRKRDQVIRWARESGLPDSVIDEKAERVYNKGLEARKTFEEFFRFTEQGIAEQWIAEHGENWRYSPESGSSQEWRHWNGLRWEPVRTAHAWGDIAKFVKGLGEEYDDARKSRVFTSSLHREIEKQARSPLHLEADRYDRHPLLLNTPAGTIDLNTGIMRKQRSKDLLSKVTGSSPCSKRDFPVWQKCLDQWTESDKDVQKLLQVIGGLCLRGDNLEQRFILLLGTGGNGKTAFSDTLATIMGDYGTRASPVAFQQTKFPQHSTELMALEGKRLVLVPELGSGYAFNVGILKSFTGEGRITARKMRGDPVEFEPVGLPIMTANSVPRFVDTGEAMKRRTIPIPFEAPIENLDPSLPLKLEPELPAILSWMIQGHLIYLKEGLQIPDRVREAHKDLFFEQDTIGRFIQDMIVNDPEKRVSRKELYESYLSWNAGQGERFKETQTGFIRQLRNKPIFGKLKEIKSGDHWYWLGIGLKPDPDLYAGDNLPDDIPF